MKREALPKLIVGAVVLAVAITLIVVYSMTGPNSANKPISDLLQESGYDKTEIAWLGLLPDDVASSIEKAYESSDAKGDPSKKNAWITNNVKYRKDKDGNIILILPNGQEYTPDFGGFFSTDASDGAKKLSDTPQASQENRVAGTSCKPEEWLNRLTDEQRAIVDIAYEDSVAAGEKRSKDEWLSDGAVATYDQDGNIVVRLPDGEGLTVTPQVSEKGNGSEGATQGSESSGEGKVLAALLTVDRVSAHPGDRDVAVSVRVGNNPGILGMTLSVSYDESAMVLNSADNGEAFRGVLTMSHSKEYKSGCMFTWDGVDLSKDDVKDGTILTLHFDIADGAEAGAHPVTVRSGNTVVDRNLQNIELTVQDGTVAVEK